MLTTIDKAIVAILPGIVAWANQKWGFHFDASPETLTLVVSAISTILVYFIPNKQVVK